MKIKVKLHPNSKQEKIMQLNKDNYEVWIKERPIDGKANIFLEKYLKDYFKKNIKIVKGLKSKNKIFEFD